MAKPRGREFFQLPLAVPNLSDWSLYKVRKALDLHELGDFSLSSWLWEQLDRNPRTNAAMNRRIMTVLGLPMKLDSGLGDGRKNDAAVTRIQPHWAKIASRPTSSKLLRGGIGMGVAFGQLIWRPLGKDWVPRIQAWHPSFFKWRPTERAYQVQTRDGLEIFQPGEGNWVIFSYENWDELPWMRGVVRAIGLSDQVRQYVVRDWARYSEVHGVPIRMLHVPFSEGDAEEKKEILAQIENPGSDMTVIVPKAKTDEESYKLELVEPTDRSWESFDRLKKAMDVDVALAITGTEVLNESGVYNPKDNSQGVRQDYTEADAVALSDFYQAQVTRPWASFNLGQDFIESAPRPCIDSTPPVDKQVLAQTILTLGQGLAALNAELRLNGQEIDPIYLEQFALPLRASTVKPPPVVAPGAKPSSSKAPG